MKDKEWEQQWHALMLPCTNLAKDAYSGWECTEDLPKSKEEMQQQTRRGEWGGRNGNSNGNTLMLPIAGREWREDRGMQSPSQEQSLKHIWQHTRDSFYQRLNCWPSCFRGGWLRLPPCASSPLRHMGRVEDGHKAAGPTCWCGEGKQNRGEGTERMVTGLRGIFFNIFLSPYSFYSVKDLWPIHGKCRCKQVPSN